MKNFSRLLILLFLFSLCTAPVHARAGGGSGGRGHSGGGRSHHSDYSSHDPHFYHGRNTNSPFSELIPFLQLGLAGIVINTIKNRHLIKAKIKTKNNMKKNNINYKTIKKRINKTYFVIQNAWSNNDMSPAIEFMTPELMETFNIKLQWMNFANKKNIMSSIRLLYGYPIFLDCRTKNKMWVYIKGKMIDYVINTKTNEIISGSTTNEKFIEYWLFTKNENNEWVLSQIKQENELDIASL